MGGTVSSTRQQGGAWDDSTFGYKERSSLNMYDHSNHIVDVRLVQKNLGLKKDLVELSELHDVWRKRSEEQLEDDECVLWYHNPYIHGQKIRTFREVAWGYKSTYFMDMSKELNFMSLGVPMMGNYHKRSKDEWRINHHTNNYNDSMNHCMIINMFQTMDFEGLSLSGMVTYVAQRLQGHQVPELTIQKGLRKVNVDATPYEEAYKQILEALSHVDKATLAEMRSSCDLEYYDDYKRQVQTDILIFLRGILSAPKYNKPLTLWRYLNVVTPVLEYRYTQVGEVVPVDRFLSTGTSPIDPKNPNPPILLRIDIPPEFPFWFLETGISFTSIEHRETVLPYTLDPTGRSLNYGLRIKKVIKNPTLKAEGYLVQPKILVITEPSYLTKPIPLHGFKPFCS